MILATNLTSLKTIFLLGFPGLHGLRFFLFFVLLMVYGATLVGNLLIVGLVSTSRQLQHPMYVFLSHLSTCDLVLSTTISPLALKLIIHDGADVSVGGCIAQFYFFGSSSVIECLLLTVMSYDRYLAICRPLQYSITMTPQFSHWLVLFCWVLGSMTIFIVSVLISNLSFCGDNVIDHFFCDFAPLILLSCSDTKALEIVEVVLATPEMFLETVFIIATYIFIVVAILRISSTSRRQKAFSTCSSHLSVVCMYYGTLTAIYVTPFRGQSLNLKKTLSLLYTVMTPLFNPCVYSLKNQEIRAAIKRWI